MMEEVSVVVRWGHLLLGISWIGMLYYFNFVQGGFFKSNLVDERQRRKFGFSGLAPSTLRWFRWVTGFILVTAIYLLWKSNTLFNGYIFFSVLMSICMLLNVFVFIWPAQLIGLGLKKGNRIQAAEKAIIAARTNNLFCLPICYCILSSLFNAYSPEWILTDFNANDFSFFLAFSVVVALELNIIFGQQIMKASVQAMAQSSVALTSVLFISLTYL